MLSRRIKNSHTTHNSNDITKESITMRRILSAVLAVISVLTIASTSFAQDVTTIEHTTTADTLATVSDTEVPSLPSAEQVPVDESESTTFSADSNVPDSVSDDDSIISDAYVAIMYLCVSGIHAPYAFGHTWICIKNTSDETITIGSRNIEPSEMASFGLHHFDGMHYDDEMNDYRGETVSAREYKLTREDLGKAADEITASRWHWYEYLTHNCTNFATSVWNKVTGSHYFAFCFPFVVQIQMAGNGLSKLTIGSR